MKIAILSSPLIRVSSPNAKTKDLSRMERSLLGHHIKMAGEKHANIFVAPEFYRPNRTRYGETQRLDPMGEGEDLLQAARYDLERVSRYSPSLLIVAGATLGPGDQDTARLVALGGKVFDFDAGDTQGEEGRAWSPGLCINSHGMRYHISARDELHSRPWPNDWQIIPAGGTYRCLEKKGYNCVACDDFSVVVNGTRWMFPMGSGLVIV